MDVAIFKDILLIFAVSLVLVLLTNRLHLPSLVGFILSGALLGPYGLKWITNYDHILILSEVGVIFLLFSVGLEFSLERLKKTTLSLLLGGTTQVLSTAALGFLFCHMIGFTIPQSLLFGCIFSLSSTAAVLRAIEGKGRLDTPIGRIGTSILLYQDLIIIPMLLLLPFTFGAHLSHGVLDETGPIFLKSVTGLFVLWIFQRYVLQRLFLWVGRTKSQELSIIFVLMLGLGIAWMFHRLGFSYILGAFIAGLLISTTPYVTHTQTQIAPFHYAFSSLFFASLGMMIDFSFVVQFPLIFLLFFFGILLLKTITGTISVLILRYPITIALPVGILTSQIGELSYLLALIGQKQGVIGDNLFHFIITIAGTTLLVTPFLAKWAFQTAQQISHWKDFKDNIGQDIKLPLKNHAIVCGFGPLGQALCGIMDRKKIDYLIVELNPKTIADLIHRNIPAVFGDGASPEILFHCNIESAKVLAIVIPDYLDSLKIIEHAKKLNPDIFIITRSKYRDLVDNLYEAGADVVISEELEGGIEIGRALLHFLKVPDLEIRELMEEIRAFGSADFF